MLADTSWTLLLSATAIGLAGGFTRGISGFGAALVMIPLLALIVPAQQSVLAVTMTTFITSIPMSISLRREANWRAVSVFSAGALVGLAPGLWVLAHLAPETLRRVVGAVVLGSALLLAVARPRKAELGKPYQLGAGLLGGVLNGAVGLGGPPIVLYQLWTGVSAQASRASFISYITLLQFMQLAVLARLGWITTAVLTSTALLTPGMMLGSYLGSLAFRAGGHKYFRAIALALLAGTGLAALLR